MTTVFLIVFYHLVDASGYGKYAAPTVLLAKTSVEACRIKGKHKDVEVLKMDVMDNGDDAPLVRPAVLVCEGDQ